MAIALAFSLACAAQPAGPALDLAELSLEELAEMQISSVSRRRESLSGAAASVYVITAEDIRRSGATTLPEILRLAPNLQVARVDTVQYAITARGFNNVVANKLLVLLDGRTLYTPMYSGVFWEMQEVMLEDIERIEVISGPGATQWGANAVNGVINIITAHSADTPGLLLAGDAGDQERGAAVRWGGEAGEYSYRVYGKLRHWDNTRRGDGESVKDEWRRGQLGFRADWTGTDQRLTFTGDVFGGESEHRGETNGIEIPRVSVSGANLMAQWTRDFDGDASLQAHAYYSHSERDEFVIFRPATDIFELDFQHGFSAGAHRLLWGGGYRRARDEVAPGFITFFMPESRTLAWQNVFVQDELEITAAVDLTAGVKLEWNDYSGMEYLPSARLAWTPAERHLLWTGVSRAVRAPSRYDRDVFFPAEPPFIVAGGPDFQAEVAHVAELGYRGRPHESLNLSATLFYHDWNDLRSGTPLPLPVFLANHIHGESWGAEAWATWQLTEHWRLSGGAWAMDKNLAFDPGTSDTVGVDNVTLHNDPDYQWRLGSRFDVTEKLELDFFLRGIGALTVQPVPGYTELDLRLAWYPLANLEISFIGRNLLHERHPEFGPAARRSEIGRNLLIGFRLQL